MLKALTEIDRMLSGEKDGIDPVSKIMERVEDKLTHAFKAASTVWFDEGSGHGQVDFVSIVSNGTGMYFAKTTHKNAIDVLKCHSLDELIESINENSHFSESVNGKSWVENSLNMLLAKTGIQISVRRMWFDFLNCWRCFLSLKLDGGKYVYIGAMTHDVFDGIVSIRFIRMDQIACKVSGWNGMVPVLIKTSIVRLMNEKLNKQEFSIDVVDLRVDASGTWVCELSFDWPRGGGATVCVYKFDGDSFLLVFSKFSKDDESDSISTTINGESGISYKTQELARDAVLGFLPSVLNTFTGQERRVTEDPSSFAEEGPQQAEDPSM